MELTYFAIFQNDSDAICIEFPDVPHALSCADNDDEAIVNAKEVLELGLHGTPLDEIPEPSVKEDICLGKNQKLCEITITMEIKKGKLFDSEVIEL